MKDKIEKVVLLTTIIFPISMFIINKILGIFDWHLRSWIWCLVFLVIHIGGYIFSIFAISTMRSKAGKFFVITIWTLICCVIGFINLIIFGLVVRIDSVKEIDGIKYIGVDSYAGLDDQVVNYYEKYNWFAYKKDNIIIDEFFENGEDIPEDRTYYNQDGSNRTIYFDRKGNIITREEFLNKEN